MKRFLSASVLVVVMQAPAPAQGVQAPWDISQIVAALSEQAARLTPVLEQLTPAEWEAKGAPSAYTAQWRAVRSEVAYLVNTAQSLQKQPERLTLSLEAYFRLQAVEMQINSLVEGVRRYQNPAVGDLLISVMGANSGNRYRLRQYITDLAETSEQEFRVIDQEAQRCRGNLLRQPPARPAAPKPPVPAAVK